MPKMYKRFLFIASWLFFINTVSAQTTVTLSDGNFMYRLTVEELPTPHYRQSTQEKYAAGAKQAPRIGMAVGTVKSITILSVKDTTKQQVIIPGKNETAWPWTEQTKGEKFIIADMDFDGNNDIRLLNSADNFTYYCWIYQPATGQFVENADLDKFVNPQFDENKKLVYQNWENTKDNSKGTDIYQYMDGKLTLIEKEERATDYTNKTITITVTKLIKGQMTVVKKEQIPLNN
jgi:hypothetical protein